MSKYREDLPQPIPQRLLSRPVERGLPVPWFVAEINGVYDFRLADKSKLLVAVRQQRCWICGERLGSYLAFAIGTMCTINKTSAEPPSHKDCAKWAIKACPFLAQKQEFRRETNLPQDIEDPGGISIDRQPGAICLWVTNKYELRQVENGLLFELGNPLNIYWFREGRQATRQEVLESIESGYPVLFNLATAEGEKCIKQLENRRLEALKLLPN